MMKISWMDASAAEQKRMQEIAGLFTEKETVDELGLGPIRDALGSMLFPGSSTLHTRAKYLLLVPWFRVHAGPNASNEVVREVERRFIKQMHAADVDTDRDGLYGQQSVQVTRLASDVHSAVLITHGIRFDPAHPVSRRFLAELGYDDAAAAPLLHPTLPAPPPEFPGVPGGFALEHHEAQWLAERMLASSPDTVLAHFLEHKPALDSRFPWDDQAAAGIGGRAAERLRIAQQFATTIHGAQLLYNLRLSQKQQDLYAESGEASAAPGDPERYRRELELWAADVAQLPRWDLEEILALVREHRGAPLPQGLLSFLQSWDRVMQSTTAGQLSAHKDALELVERRERAKKGGQSRFRNRALLAGWGGASAAGRFSMRWGSSVRRILLDIHEGLDA